MSIQKRRVDHGWAQEDLALHSGLSVRTIQRIEAGKRASLESLKCLAAVFETSVSELVEEQAMISTTSVDQKINAQVEKNAIAYVQNVRAFHMNWIAYLIIMPLLVVLNLILSPEFLWVVIVGLAWGFSIPLHGAVIFRMFKVFSGEWEQKEFKKQMDRHGL